MTSQTTGHFSIGTHMAGAVTFTCALTLSGGRAVGMGAVTQAINPPLDIDTYLSGTVANIVWGADVTQVIALTGHAYRTPMPPNPENVECTMQLDSRNPAKCTASLSYLEDGVWHTLENLPVQVKWQYAPD